MQDEFPDWLRVANINIDSEYVKKRWAGTDAFLKSASTDLVLDLVRLALGVPAADEVNVDRFRACFRKADHAFPSRNNDTEMRALACAALLTAMADGGDDVTDAAALGVVSGDCRGLGAPPPVPALVERAAAYLAQRAVEVRTRTGPTVPAFPADKLGALIERAKAQAGQDDTQPFVDSVVATFEYLHGALDGAMGSLREAIAAIESRQAAQDEEANIAWWVVGGWSKDQNVPMANLALPEACLVAAKELADLTVLLPGPVAAEAYLYRMLPPVATGSSSRATIREAVNAIPRDWRTSCLGHQDWNVLVGIAPVLMAMHASLTTDGSDDWLPVYRKTSRIEPDTPMSPLDLAMQTYHELQLARVAIAEH